MKLRRNSTVARKQLITVSIQFRKEKRKSKTKKNTMNPGGNSPPLQSGLELRSICPRDCKMNWLKRAPLQQRLMLGGQKMMHFRTLTLFQQILRKPTMLRSHDQDSSCCEQKANIYTVNFNTCKILKAV